MKTGNNRSQMIAIEEQEELESRKRLLSQARKGHAGAQSKLWQLYHVRITAGKDVAPEVVARVESWMNQ